MKLQEAVAARCCHISRKKKTWCCHQEKLGCPGTWKGFIKGKATLVLHHHEGHMQYSGMFCCCCACSHIAFLSLSIPPIDLPSVHISVDTHYRTFASFIH